MFLSEQLQRQCGRRQVMERMVEPIDLHAMQRIVMIHHSSLHNMPVHMFYHTFHDTPPTILKL
jgi:hypothetical protein